MYIAQKLMLLKSILRKEKICKDLTYMKPSSLKCVNRFFCEAFAIEETYVIHVLRRNRLNESLKCILLTISNYHNSDSYHSNYVVVV